MTDTPQLLLAHHLKALKLPTFLREYDKLARQCAAEGLDHIRFLLRLAELEPLSFTLKSIQQMMGRPTPITWNHRVLLTEEQGEKSYCIHEVHYDEDGSVMGLDAERDRGFRPIIC